MSVKGLYGVDCAKRNWLRRFDRRIVHIVYHDVRINRLKAPEVQILLDRSKYQHIKELDYVAGIEDDSVREYVFFLIARHSYCPTYYYQDKFYIQKTESDQLREGFLKVLKRYKLI